MDIQSIKTFVQVATLENYTKAANEMNYAQSTVTMQLKRLEEELGYPLFEKIGRRNYLTTQGRNFLSYANRILSLMQEATSLSEDAKSMKGVIRVGALESLVFSRILPKLSEYRNEYPNAEIVLKIAQGSELINMLRENRIDVACISSTMNSDSSLKCLSYNKEKLVFVASAEHPLANKKPMVEEILSYPVIATEPSGYCYVKLHQLAASFNVSLRHAVTLDSVHGVLQLLRDKISVAFLPIYAVNSPDLAVLDAIIPEQTCYSQMLVLRDKWCSPLIEGLTSLIKS